ncbi:CU044_5270 family protein [Kitasatospora sp. NPDC008050]|uniref:CU044_5270 family protein n=1 Tax=Kitasatospora sp. NPDC008050 TaxID=3364021 RepID=UPI0036E481D3
MNQNDDLTELRNRFPTPSTPVLSTGRRQQLREYLMRETNETNGTNETVSTTGAPVRRLGWAALPVLAGGLALALVLPTGGGPGPDNAKASTGTAGPSASQGTPGAVRAVPANAVQALDQVATVAAAMPATNGGDFVYVKRVIGSLGFQAMPDGGNTYQYAQPHTQEIWESVDGSRTGLISTGDGANSSSPLRPDAGSVENPTVQFLRALPADPDALLKVVHDATKGEKNPPNQAAFKALTGMLDFAPPQVAATIYKAAQKIPGVTLVDDVTDATGRHGIGVGVVDGGAQNLWVFDKDSLHYLGLNWETTSDSQVGPKGTVISQESVLQQAYVDQVGVRPAQ